MVAETADKDNILRPFSSSLPCYDFCEQSKATDCDRNINLQKQRITEEPTFIT